MGVPKQVLPLGDTTMVGAVVRAAERSMAVDVLVVTGFHREEVEAAVGSSARLVHNEAATSGNMSSLLVGLDAAGDVDGIVVLLSDIPQVRPDVIDAVITGTSTSGALVGWVEYVDAPGHPVALTAGSYADIRTLEGPKALWRYLVSRDPSDVFKARIGSTKPIDVNTSADYQRVIRSYAGQGAGEGSGSL
jgi:molybdenum cofactor cytidylyltransferase